MKRPTFSERLAYARWLVHFRTGEAPGNAEIGRAVGRTGPWVTKWSASETPPRDFEVHEPLASFLGVDERWLFRDEGDPPKIELWKPWIAERRKAPRMPGFKEQGATPPAAAKKGRAS